MNGLSETLQEGIDNQKINDTDVKLLENVVNLLTNDFLKARVYHILFLKRKNRSYIINAMNYYYQISEILLDNDFCESINHLFIILYLGNLIHNYNEPYNSSKEKILELLYETQENEINKTIYILSFINKLKIGDNEHIISISCKIADKLILSSNDGQAIIALEIAKENIHPNDSEKIRNVNRKIADCYIRIARNDNGLRAAHFLLKAINTLSAIKNTREERLSLYEEMRDYQREAMLDLKYYETSPFNISPIQEHVKSILKESKDLFDMLFRTACYIIDIEEIDKIKNEEINLPKSITDLFFSRRIYIDHEGIPMNIDDIPAIIDFNDKSDEEKKLLWSKIVEKIKLHHFISCCHIQEAIRILNLTYFIKYQDILSLCQNTPFVPQGHEEFFAKGIVAVLNGDFLTASHLLVPQVENSLRHLLALGAEEPTTLHSNNEQERKGLKALLENPEIIRIFGIDGIIHLHTVLLDKRYPGLRHSIAHGFTHSSHFYGTGSIYLWWLILRIIMIPYKDCWEKIYLHVSRDSNTNDIKI